MSNIRCGSFTKANPDQVKAGIEFIGSIALMDRLNETIILRRHPRAGQNNDLPDFEIYAIRQGAEYSIGAAWLKHSDKAADFLSMTLDNPTWSAPLNLTAFAPDTKEPGKLQWSIVWSRPRGARVQDAA